MALLSKTLVFGHSNSLSLRALYDLEPRAAGGSASDARHRHWKMTVPSWCLARKKNNWLVVSTYPSEKYEFVKWEYEIPIYIYMEKTSSKPPTRSEWLQPLSSSGWRFLSKSPPKMGCLCKHQLGHIKKNKSNVKQKTWAVVEPLTIFPRPRHPTMHPMFAG